MNRPASIIQPGDTTKIKTKSKSKIKIKKEGKKNGR